MNLGKRNSGLTLIEILVVIGVIGAIFVFAAVIDIGSITRESVISEQANLIALLGKARSRAMNNIEHSPHGVHIGADEYVLFQGNTFNSADTANESIERNPNITIDTSSISTTDIVFNQLRGDAEDTGSLTLSDGVRSKTITIRQEGLIEW